MAFFRNSTVNRLNLHYGIHALALSGGGAFFTVFLLKAGVPAPGVLTALAAILAGRFCVRPLILPIARRVGVKPLLIAGTLFSAAQYPLLAQVNGAGRELIILCVVSSFGDMVYWTSYHAYFAALGDAEHRGHQIGAREAIAALIGIVGPLVGGWALSAFGPQIAFGATAVILSTAALPILGAPNVAVPDQAPGALREAWPGVLMFAADGWANAGYTVVWQIALFMALGQSFTAFGGAMAAAAVVGAASGLALGRWIDLGHGAKAVWLGVAAAALCGVLRATGYGGPAIAIAANASGALVTALYTPTVMTAVYNQAQRSACAMRFHIAAEAGWDAGGAAGLLTAAALLTAGAPLWSAIGLSLFGVAAMAQLLRRYYAAPVPAQA
jgi:MFS transporter, DHA1 family, inner membrane transport protein